jgi:hypothetical protein
MLVGAAGTSAKEAKASTVPLSANPDGAVHNTTLLDEVRQGHVGVCGLNKSTTHLHPAGMAVLTEGLACAGAANPVATGALALAHCPGTLLPGM